VTLLVEHDAVARGLVWGAVAVGIAGEILATYAGRVGGSGKAVASSDRGTKHVVVAGVFLALMAAWLIGNYAPSTVAGADTWPVLVAGVAFILVGSGLRVWAVATLGRFFRREVTILEGQAIVRRGPYRLIRHPAYLGTIIVVFGLGLAIGGWIGAVVAAAVAVAGHVPRIRVEEAALADAFADHYRDYAEATARLVPGVW
jgi:protein-S-isoprenylcysteine O-methyltransferase Ste14